MYQEAEIGWSDLLFSTISSNLEWQKKTFRTGRKKHSGLLLLQKDKGQPKREVMVTLGMVDIKYIQA